VELIIKKKKLTCYGYGSGSGSGVFFKKKIDLWWLW